MKKLIENIYLNKLTKHELREQFNNVVEKEYSAKQVADVILYIKTKQKLIVNIPNSIDVCGIWWSWLDRLNTSTLTALKLAKQWIWVAKHWNKSSSWSFGSFDLLKELNYEVPENKNDIVNEYEKNNVVFLYANLLYPFLRELSKLRKQYGKPTIFNILWPLLSPVNSSIHLTWCWFEDKMELMIETFKLLWKEKVLVVRWNDWLDEVTLSTETNVFELDNWKITNYEISPEQFWFNRVSLEKFLISDNNKKIEISKNIILWEEKSPYNDLVSLNVKVVKKILIK